MNFLDRSEQWQTELRIDVGLAWLERMYGGTALESQLASSKLFWAWWNNKWAARDQDMSRRLKVLATAVLTYKAGEHATMFFHEPAEFAVFYMQTHNPAKLNLLLDAVVIESVNKLGRAA
ncbi:hypothetical protein [Hymenobacter sp. B81]|uniref:hypothetical protein n=1 Tax=Hymenobacter sp. B81 TaxID=3344878 RepID=UPI0037DC54CD